MLDELVALAKLADVDAQALSTDTELAEIPARIAELDADVKRLGELLAAEKQELSEADALLAAQDGELSGQGQALARSKAKGARARNAREADAVERELETIRRQMRDRETERETLKQAIEKRKGSLERHEKEFTELQAFAGDEKAKASARMQELTALREQVLAGRQALVQKLPEDVLRRYELIRKRRGGVGIVGVQDGICIGCNMTLAPNQVIAVQRAETFEQCPRCQRMLFAPEAVKKLEESRAETANGA